MRFVRSAGLVPIALALGACALTPPRAEDMASVPVVRFGEAAPPGKEFVLRFPAGTPLPVLAAVRGTILERPAETTLQVSLKRDIYVYKQWVSFDGRTWMRGDQGVDGKFAIELPGLKDGRNPGAMTAQFDAK